MTRLKSALVVLATIWVLEALLILPLMAIRGASGQALAGAFVFAGIVAALIVGAPVVVAEFRRRQSP